MTYTPCKSNECSIPSGELQPANRTTMTVAPAKMASRALLLVALEEHLCSRGHHHLLLQKASSTSRPGAAVDVDIGGGGQSYWCVFSGWYPRREVELLRPFTSSSTMLSS